jgi:5,10-methylenetetrahydromethanopterin reductase
MKFGAIAFHDRLSDYLDWLEVAEGLGFDLACHGDTQNLAPEMFVALTAAALRTRRIRLASTVANPVTRHPAVMASGAAALQQLSGGRFSLGIATGDSALKVLGEKPAKVAELEAYCRTVRALCEGRSAEWNGHRLQMNWPVTPTPIWIAAEGPRMLDLAGRLGDGVIFGHGVTEPVIKDSIRRVRESAVAAGRDPDAVEIWVMVKPYFAESEGAAWREMAWTLAASANHAFRGGLDDKFVPDALKPALRALMAGYHSHEHNKPGQGAHNASLVEDGELLDFLGRRFLVAGPPERIVERLRELASWGATNLIFTALQGSQNIAYTQRLWNEVLRSLI